jgi:hypothetical protein
MIAFARDTTAKPSRVEAAKGWMDVETALSELSAEGWKIN